MSNKKNSVTLPVETPAVVDLSLILAALPGAVLETLPRIEHALTHFDWVLHTMRVEAPEGNLPGGTWVAREKLADYALPAPLKKLIDES